MGLILRKNPEVVAAANKMAGKSVNLTQLTWKGFVVNNQFPVMMGNILGGTILVGLAFWFVYLRPQITFSLNIKEDFKKGD
jgi:formate/nitrite transporter FocA (FNT family)